MKPHIWLLDMDGWHDEGHAILARSREEAVTVALEYDEETDLEIFRDLLHVAQRVEGEVNTSGCTVKLEGQESDTVSISVSVDADEWAALLWASKPSARRVMLYDINVAFDSCPF